MAKFKPKVAEKLAAAAAEKAAADSTIVAPQAPPPPAAAGAAPQAGNGRAKCELCGVKTKNYGLASEGYRLRWCGPCGRPFGGQNPRRVPKMRPPTPEQ